ncbi:hypothetical protein ACS0TY_024141 [Phlomoides rotata]
MNISTSEQSSSGFESGWTTYLDQLDDYNSRGICTNYEEKGRHMNHQTEEEEDLSMVSDASSGPPNYSCTIISQEKTKNKSKTKEAIRVKKQQSLCLDDTASSPPPPLYTFSQKTENDDDDPEGTKKHLSFFNKGGKSEHIYIV